MRGIHHIRVSNRTLVYDFTISRNITIIQGNSATGKTTLVDMISEHESLGEDSAVNLSCDCPCVVLQGNNWQKQIEGVENSIVFIDEGNRFVESEDFAHTINHSSNYYVIVTREALYNLPYSVNEIYGIRSSGRYGSLQPVYHEMYRIYTFDNNVSDSVKDIVVEDSKSGYEFFNAVKNDGINCVSANGNSHIFAIINEKHLYNDVLIIADGAAFGPYMELLSMLILKHPGIVLYLPESFEWLILSSGLIDGKGVRDILSSPSDYIDSTMYFSWEQYFTALLINETRDSYLAYNKSHLNQAYLQDKQKNAIINSLPDMVKNEL